MAAWIKLLLFLLLCCSSEYLVQSHKTMPHWDSLLFVQSWLPTNCKVIQHIHKSVCIMPADADRWTIHGLWANLKSCPAARPIQQREIHAFQQELDEAWPDIHKRTVSFWEYELSKHGTCFADYPALDSTTKYLRRSLDLHKQYDIAAALEKVHIMPSLEKTYKTDDFVKAFQYSFGYTPLIICFQKDNKQFIFEVRLCFNKNMEAMECSASDMINARDELYNDGTQNCICKPTMDVIYPNYI